MKIQSCKKEIINPYSFRTPIRLSKISNNQFPNGKFDLPFSFSNQILEPSHYEKHYSNKNDFIYRTSPSHSIFQCLSLTSKYFSESNSKTKLDTNGDKKNSTNSYFNLSSYKKNKFKNKATNHNQNNEINQNSFVQKHIQNNKNNTQFNNKSKWVNEKDNLKLYSVQTLYPLIGSKTFKITSSTRKFNNGNTLEFLGQETKNLLDNLKQNNMTHEEFSKILYN